MLTSAQPSMNAQTRGRGRPRSLSARHKILAATIQLLQLHGYAPLTMESIASHADVSKQTLYRWWPSKGAVLLEVLGEVADAPTVDPHETLEVNLRAYVAQLFSLLDGISGTISRAIVAETQRDADFASHARTSLILPGRDQLLAMFNRAALNQEIDANENFDALADIVLGSIWFRLLSGHLPLDTAFADYLVALVTRWKKP